MVRKIAVLLVALLAAAPLVNAQGDCAPISYAKLKPPRYPPEAIRDHLTGKVMVTVKVGADGLPGTMSIDRSSGSEALDKAAIETIATWRFNPMVCNGKATDSFAIVPVDFSLVPDSLAASDGAASSSGWEVAPDPSPMEFPDVRQAEKYLSSRPDVHELPTKPGEFSTVRMFQNRDFSRIWYLHKLPLLHFVEVTRWREEMRQGKRVGLYAHLCDGSADACASNLADEVEWMRKNPPPPPPHPPASE